MSYARAALLVLLPLCACAVQPSLADARWSVTRCGVAAGLRGLAPVSDLVAYVGGAAGTLRKTTDGGVSWTDVAPPGARDCDFRDVEARADGVVVAMVAGQPARLYRSPDGGDSWQLVHEDPRPAAFFDAVAFEGARGVVFGDAIGGRLCLLETVDGGRSWRDVPSPALPAPGDGEAAFAASGTCLIGGPSGFSLVTGGGPCRHVWIEPGVRYTAVDLPLQTGAPSKGAFSVAWRGARGVAVGGDYRRPADPVGTAAVSADGGRTWQASDALGFRSGVAWLPSGEVLAVGSHGASWSGDGGRTFLPFGEEGFHCVACAPDGAVWACGADGRVARLVFAR